MVLEFEERYMNIGRQTTGCYLELSLRGDSYENSLQNRVWVCSRSFTEPNVPKLIVGINSQLTKLCVHTFSS